MSKLLARLWTGVVGAVTGACIGLVLCLLLLASQFPLERAFWAVAILGLLGALVGVTFGNKRLGGK